MFSPHYSCPSLARFSYINAFTVSFADLNALCSKLIIQGCTSNFTTSTCLLAIKRDERFSDYIFTGASSANEPKCEISCRVGGGPKDEETVDPDSIIPSHCSIKNGSNISRNMTWKEVNDKITPKPPKPGLQCLVLKRRNSEKRIYFASKCCVYRYQQ